MGYRGWLFALIVLLFTAPIVPAEVMQLTWLVNNTTNIGGLPASRIGNPQAIVTPYGAAVWFNGITDGLKLATNPIAGLTNFTVEMIFRPDASTHTSSRSPRTTALLWKHASFRTGGMETRSSAPVTRTS